MVYWRFSRSQFKDKRSFYAAKIIDSNPERTKFTVCQLDCDNPKKIEIE